MTHTTDQQYADLMARLNAIPATQPHRREVMQSQSIAWLVKDLIKINGEATW